MERRQPLEGIIMFPRSIRIVPALALFLSILAFAASGADAPAPDDKDALAGMKEVKVAFDIHEGDGKGLLNRLNVIDETRQSLIRQGVTPHFVLAFRGPATKLVQTDAEKIKPEDRLAAAQIAAKLQDMGKAPGIDSLEQCSVAIRQQGTKAENVVPAVKVVGNGWISLMAYQSRGYAYISP
jgi:intracellular sulfur oxidation DsrE/DsrF family protein